MNFHECFFLCSKEFEGLLMMSPQGSVTQIFLWWNLSIWWWIVKRSLSYTFHFSCHCHIWLRLQTGYLYLAKLMSIFGQTNVSVLAWVVVFSSSPPKFIGKKVDSISCLFFS